MSTKTLLILLATAACAHAQIDLTPRTSTREFQGITFPQLEFRDGTTRITYEPPSKWTASARGPARLSFTPPEGTQAQATIEVAESGLPTFADDGLELMKQQTLALAPPDAQERAIDDVQVNGLMLNGYPTAELSASFMQFGQRFKMSILFVNMGSSHLRFRLICRETDFALLHRTFRATVPSWQWMQATVVAQQ